MGTGGSRNGGFDDEPWLPIKFGPVSNGEFHPVPHTPFVREVIRRTHRLADDNARRLGISRREFLTGVTGAAATLFVLGACSKEEAAERGESPGGNGLAPDDMAYAIDIATRIGCDGRVLMHGGAYPHRGPIDAALMAMSDLRDRYDVAAWKIYTMTPADAHFYFDDHDPDRPQIGQRFIEHVRDIGPPIICTHKGISSIVGSTPELASPVDIGPAAARNPDVGFVVYHSGFEPGGGGVGAYDPDDPAPQGVDRLIRSLEAAGVEPNGNVYAELGGTWWFLMRDPTAAAHVLGKLLKYVGEDRVVWGTDSIWFGTPQDQIQALRTFQISEELQERHGYPALTDELKAKIFGLNSAGLYGIEPITGPCDVSVEDVEAVRASLPPARTYGPTTYAESAAMIAAHQAGYLA